MEKLTNKELLIRIDERQRRMMQDVQELKENLLTKVTDDKEYQEMKRKVDLMWDNWNKLKGYLVAAALGGGIATTGIEYLLKMLD